MSKFLLLALSVCLFSMPGFAKTTAEVKRVPASAAVDPLAPLPEKSCEEAYKNIDSGKISDLEEAQSACTQAMEAACAKFQDGTGDGRYITGVCRTKAAFEGYRAAKRMK